MVYTVYKTWFTVLTWFTLLTWLALLKCARGARGGRGGRGDKADKADKADTGGEVAEGADMTDVAFILILSYGLNTMGIGYMALWVFGAKYVSGQDGLDGYP